MAVLIEETAEPRAELDSGHRSRSDEVTAFAMQAKKRRAKSLISCPAAAA
jgi:hypothetical protein